MCRCPVPDLRARRSGDKHDMVNGISGGGGLLEAAAAAHKTGSDITAALMRKVNDQMKQDGENAIALIESAGPRGGGSLGHHIDTVA